MTACSIGSTAKRTPRVPVPRPLDSQRAVAHWDNRAIQHYGNSNDCPQVRVMERVSIAGGRPC